MTEIEESKGHLEMQAGSDTQSVPLKNVAIMLNRRDDVAIVRNDLRSGSVIRFADGRLELALVAQEDIPAGHKIALHQIQAGQAVRRYGQVIGFASQPISPGQHVHTHNLKPRRYRREARFGEDAHPVSFVPETERRTFLGYRRSDGRVGTRNYIAVISTVNCSAFTCQEVARYFSPEKLADYPNVDGVIALTHPYGCPMRSGSPDYILLQRTLAGMARHPNVGASLFVGLGCESNQVDDLLLNCDLCAGLPECPPSLVIQELGGLRKTVQAGIEAVEGLLPSVNSFHRTQQPVSELMVALQCGGSDAWSGVTANPLVGWVADEIVRQGGVVVLAETPEIYGAEHLLLRRAASREAGQKLVEIIKWWENYARRRGLQIDNNRSVGNAAGGLTTIFEKSLGAVAKAGTSPLNGVYDYAEQVAQRGFIFMNTPGYDPVSVTGQVAGGCNLVLFTTGRGSVFGFRPAPSIKISTTTALYRRMMDDIDLDAGVILDGKSIKEAADDLFELLIAVASGKPSKSEAQGVGEAEFNPWHLGSVL